VPQEHYKEPITTPEIGGTHAAGDGSPLTAAGDGSSLTDALVIGHGNRGGSTSPSRVVPCSEVVSVAQI
jgi:hypothetical protein